MQNKTKALIIISGTLTILILDYFLIANGTKIALGTAFGLTFSLLSTYANLIKKYLNKKHINPNHNHI